MGGTNVRGSTCIARATGLNIVMGAGWYRESYYDRTIFERSVDAIADADDAEQAPRPAEMTPLRPVLQEHLAHDVLGQPAGVDVGGVDEVDPGLQAHVDLPSGLVHIGRADAGEPAAAAERHRAHGERGDPQARTA